MRKPEKQDERIKTEEKAAMILKKVQEGENFSDLARKYSDDPSGKDGGDLGFIRKENLLKEFIDAVSPMKHGEISAPFWTERGLHIIKLEERKDTKTPEEMKNEAEKMVSDKVFMERYNVWIKSLREKSFIEIKL